MECGIVSGRRPFYDGGAKLLTDAPRRNARETNARAAATRRDCRAAAAVSGASAP